MAMGGNDPPFFRRCFSPKIFSARPSTSRKFGIFSDDWRSLCSCLSMGFLSFQKISNQNSTALLLLCPGITASDRGLGDQGMSPPGPDSTFPNLRQKRLTPNLRVSPFELSLHPAPRRAFSFAGDRVKGIFPKLTDVRLPRPSAIWGGAFWPTPWSRTRGP